MANGMLASDLNNNEFVGATNPDAMLAVEFYWHEPLDKWGSEVATQEAGRRVEKKLPRQPFVRISRPGDNTSILEAPVREVHKQRFPEKWLYFQLSEGLIDGAADIPGFKLDEWTYLDDKPEQKRDLKYLRFLTVEQLAGASDGQIQRIMGGLGLREMAKQALREKLGADVKAQIEAKDKQLAEQGEAIEALKAQMNALLDRMSGAGKGKG